MSTDHQQYSTRNQADKIAEYAEQRNIEIVCTYADEGKSGLSIGGRAALQKLIADVESGDADFEIILVYDVSRWGRFQDADESAYYEYICRRAGIPVAYCAEQFENDGSPVSTIVKGVKRAMAGEYSRELSTKVFAGQCRLVEMGFRQGGQAGYGLRRVMVDPNGEIRGVLEPGEHKGIQTHRVILMPGPAEEVQIVNDMFKWLIRDDLYLSEIAARLNSMGVQTHSGLPWSYRTVSVLMINEKYIGNNIYNRRSHKLKKLRVQNPPEMWIRKEGAFEGIVPAETFFTAQNIMFARNNRYSNTDLLEKLRKLFDSVGSLSGFVIDQSPEMPNSCTYIQRFGTLARAYELVGFRPQRDMEYQEVNRRMRRLHPEIVERTQIAITELGGQVWRDPKTDLLHVNNELVVCLVLARCQTLLTGVKRWRIRFDPAELSPDITIVIRLCSDNREALDYYVIPTLDVPAHNLNVFNHRGSSLDCFRFDSLDFFFGMVAREKVVRSTQLLTPASPPT
jgi:DNA invertase Pin-like site-specific DNA recombinase